MSIHNAPSLESVIFRKTAIRLMDMVNLHTKLPSLKRVVLDKVSLYVNDTVGATVSATTKKN
jgi:hypothetical protein